MNSKRHVRNRLLDICPEVYLSKLLSLVNPIFVIQCHSWNTWALGFIQADLARLNRTFFTCLCLLWDTKLELKQKSIPTFGLCDFTAEQLRFTFWIFSLDDLERAPTASGGLRNMSKEEIQRSAARVQRDQARRPRLPETCLAELDFGLGLKK